ncbi:MAG TPA: glycosyltransferase family 9 protein [Ktedonobacterales bacterium]|jgi:ADP-heptose:LPS heptosyltransferase
MNRIIVFRPGALGDTLLAFPALAALRRAFPGARLHAIGSAPALALARDAGLADEVGAFDDLCWAELFAEDGIRSAEARQILDGAQLAVLWLRNSVGLAARNLRALGISSLVSAPGRPPEGARVHAAEYLLETLMPIIGAAAQARSDEPPLTLAQEARAWAEGEWARRGLAGAPTLVIHPGSGGRDKCWPSDRFAALAGRFIAAGWRALVIEGPADAAPASAALAALPAGRAQRVGGLALPQLAALLARAALYVGNDSGVSHLSALLGAPTLALFGPTDPAIWSPRGPRARVVWAGAAASAGVTLPPMSALTVDRVYDAAQTLLRSCH